MQYLAISQQIPFMQYLTIPQQNSFHAIPSIIPTNPFHAMPNNTPTKFLSCNTLQSPNTIPFMQCLAMLQQNSFHVIPYYTPTKFLSAIPSNIPAKSTWPQTVTIRCSLAYQPLSFTENFSACRILQQSKYWQTHADTPRQPLQFKLSRPVSAYWLYTHPSYHWPYNARHRPRSHKASLVWLEQEK